MKYQPFLNLYRWRSKWSAVIVARHKPLNKIRSVFIHRHMGVDVLLYLQGLLLPDSACQSIIDTINRKTDPYCHVRWLWDTSNCKKDGTSWTVLTNVLAYHISKSSSRQQTYWVCLHAFEYPDYQSHPGDDNILDMFTWAQRNPVYVRTESILDI